RQRRFSPREAAVIVEAVARALQYAHTRGLVHRDVKPANILLPQGIKPCPPDFGLALRHKDFGQGGRLTATAAHIEPRQARGEGHRVDGRSDIFSLGVVFYELLTGLRPFRGGTKKELSDEIIHGEARPPRHVEPGTPDDLEQVCLKAMAKWADKRYVSAEE